MRFDHAISAAAACVTACPASAALVTVTGSPNEPTRLFTFGGSGIGEARLTTLSIAGAPAGAVIEALYGQLTGVIADDGTFDFNGSANPLNDSYGRYFGTIRLRVGNDHARFTVVSYTITGTDRSSAAPEPATWAMMMLGFGAVGGVLRKRHRRAWGSRAALAEDFAGRSALCRGDPSLDADPLTAPFSSHCDDIARRSVARDKP